MSDSKSNDDPSKVNTRRLRSQDDAVAHMLAKDIFTRERYYFMTRVLMALSGAVAVLALVVLLLAIKPAQHTYILTDDEGRLTPITPLNGPVDAIPVVSEWVVQSVIAAYSYDFSNYRAQLSAVASDFTPEGWLGFEDALKKSGDLQSVVDNKYVVSAVVTGAAVLQSSGVVNGTYQWVFNFPITLSYESAVQRSSSSAVATVTVVRVKESLNPRGLGIESIVLQ